jgi:hypothetical protein
MYFNALRWSMGLVAGDATPIPVHQQKVPRLDPTPLAEAKPRLVYAPK